MLLNKDIASIFQDRGQVAGQDTVSVPSDTLVAGRQSINMRYKQRKTRSILEKLLAREEVAEVETLQLENPNQYDTIKKLREDGKPNKFIQEFLNRQASIKVIESISKEAEKKERKVEIREKQGDRRIVGYIKGEPQYRSQFPVSERGALKKEDLADIGYGVKQFGRGLVSGLLQLGESAGTAQQFVGGLMQRIGTTDMKSLGKVLEVTGKQGYEYFKELGEGFQTPEELQGSIIENPALLAKGAWWAYNIGQVLPSFAAVFVPAVGAARYIQILGKTYKWAPQLVARLARIAPAAVGGTIGGVLEGTSTYQEVLEKGGSKAEAEAAMILMTAATGALNAISLNVMLKKMPPGVGKSIVKYLTSGVTEGLTEWAEEPAEAFIKMGLGHAELSDVYEQTIQGANVFPVAMLMGFGGTAVAQRISKEAPLEVEVEEVPEAEVEAPAEEAVAEAEVAVVPEKPEEVVALEKAEVAEVPEVVEKVVEEEVKEVDEQLQDVIESTKEKLDKTDRAIEIAEKNNEQKTDTYKLLISAKENLQSKLDELVKEEKAPEPAPPAESVLDPFDRLKTLKNKYDYEMTKSDFKFAWTNRTGKRNIAQKSAEQLQKENPEMQGSEIFNLLHERVVKTALAEGKSVPAEVLKDYPDLAKEAPKAVVEPAEDVADKFARKTAEATEKFKSIIGKRVKNIEGEWELVAFNDLGVPYFSKVVNGKVQKKQFTLSEFGKEWAENQLKPTEAPSVAPEITEPEVEVTMKEINNAYPIAENKVDGRVVLKETPNLTSIRSTFDADTYTVLKDVREVKLSLFPEAAEPEETDRNKELANEIKESGEINPLIVVIDEEGLKKPYILEGSHRFDALRIINARSFPAVVVVNESEEAGLIIKTPKEPVTKPTVAPETAEKSEYENNLKQLNKNLGTQTTFGVNPENFVLLTKIGAYHFRRGANTLSRFTVAIKEAVGRHFNKIKDKIREIFEKVKKPFISDIPEGKKVPPKDEDPVQKLTRLINEAKPAREETEELKHEELQKRVARAAAILEKGTGREAFQKAKAPLKGQLPQAEFAPPESSITEGDIIGLFNKINFSEMEFFQKLNTSEALIELLNGKIPTRGDIVLLERIFGGDLIKAILSKRSLGEKAWENTVDALNIPRTLLTAIDMSASLRQGAFLASGHPILFARAMKAQVKAMLSEKNAVAIDESIRNGKYFKEMTRNGLYIASRGVSTKVSDREEAFMSQFARKIPGVKISERAYVTFLNKLRSDVYSTIVTKWEGTGKTIKDYKDLAMFINAATGRGNIKTGDLGGVLNAVFFSPRFQVSRIEAPLRIFTSTNAVRKEIARDLVAFTATGIMMLSLLALVAGAVIEMDPRSSDFGKGKIGNTRIDFWAGLLPIVRLVAQLITNQRKSTGTGRISNLDRDETITRFIQSKLSPVAGLAVDVIKGETFLGEELSLDKATFATQAYQRLTPLFLQDMIDGIRFGGLSGGIMTLPAFLGVGVQTWKEPEYVKILNHKNQIALETYGKNWDDVTKEEQDLIEKNNPEIEIMERQAKFQEQRAAQLDRTIKEQKRIGKEIRSKLDEPIRKELDRLLIVPFGISRNIASGFYLNDQRYARYQELVISEVNKAVNERMKFPSWKLWNDERKRDKITKVINEAKANARKVLLKEIGAKNK